MWEAGEACASRLPLLGRVWLEVRMGGLVAWRRGELGSAVMEWIKKLAGWETRRMPPVLGAGGSEWWTVLE